MPFRFGLTKVDQRKNESTRFRKASRASPMTSVVWFCLFSWASASGAAQSEGQKPAAPEGGAHQSINTPLIGIGQPRVFRARVSSRHFKLEIYLQEVDAALYDDRDGEAQAVVPANGGDEDDDDDDDEV